MNYGRFFRLNKNISKVEEGVVIFDYIDLPAYFESSMENIMTPKYPISMTIASNSAQFRLHYSAYKDIDEKTGKETYSYEGGKRVVHMEEVVLELPFSESSSDQLAETINSIYETSFPQRVDTDGNKSGEETNDNKVMGARFLGKLIGQRYHNNRDLKHSIAVQQYKNMQIALDRLPSYSTLWLMDIPRDTFTQTSVAKSSSDDKTKGKKSSDFPLCLSSKDGKNIVKFLRKLLLDFMFDLKHSDVFQNSSYYQRMYSGLMSNFYFSALMHKCEYFYYRDLTEEAIKLNDDKKRIIYLYAEELFKAEKLWTQDIMNPKANIYFNHSYIGQDTPSIKDGYFRYICKKTIRIFSNCQYRRWNSWFAEPEEEMRRVCFTMKDNMEEKRYICNAETLSEYLDLEKEKEEKKEKEEEREKYAIVTGMIHQKDNNRVLISQWFLKRYAIQDILHLHLFKYSDWPFFISLIAVILYLFICPKFITEKFWNHIHYQSIIFLFLFFCPFFICIIRGLTKFPYPKQQIHILWGRCSIIGMKYEDSRISLFQARCKMISKRLIAILLTVLFAAPIAILTPTIVANPILIKVLFFYVRNC